MSTPAGGSGVEGRRATRSRGRAAGSRSGSRRSPRFSRTDVAAVLAVAALAGVARLAWIYVVRPQPVSDYLFYYRSAVSIGNGDGFSILGHPTAFFPVGYPAFLGALFSVFGSDISIMKLASVCLWMAAAALAFVFGSQVGGRAVGLIAGIVVALYPEYVIYAGLGASENLMVPLLLAVCVALAGAGSGRVSARRGAVVGLLLGLSILVRSTALPLPLLFSAYLIARDRRRALRPAAAMLGVCTLVIVPWVVRNQVVIGAPVMSTNGGYTLWMGLNPDATGGSTIKGGNLPWPIDSARQERAVNSELTGEALRYLFEQPGDAFGLVPTKARLLFTWSGGVFVSSGAMTPRDGSFKRTVPRTKRPLERSWLRWSDKHIGLFRTLHKILWIGGSIGLLWAVVRRRPGADWVALIVVFWIVFHAVLVHGQTRFLVSVSPLLTPFLGYLIVSLVRALRPRRSRGRSAASVS